MTAVPVTERTPAELATEILAAIEREPLAFSMYSWVRADDPEEHPVLLPEESPASCGTTLCVAGWAMHLSGYKVDTVIGAYINPGNHHRYHMEPKAAELLGLSQEEAAELFHTSGDVAKIALQQIADGKSFNMDQARTKAWGRD